MAILLAVAVSCGVLLLVAYSMFPFRLKSLLVAALAVAPKAARPRIRRIGADVASTLDWTFSWQKVIAVVALSAGIVISYSMSVIVLAGGGNFGLLKGLFSQAFAALGAAIPLAPGYVGTLHAVMLEGLVLCGVDRGKAQAMTILFHAVPYITVTLLGLYYFFKLNVSFKDISEAEKKIEKEDQAAHE